MTPSHPKSPRTLTFITALAVLSAPLLSQASDYYLQREQTQGWHWHTTGAGTGWFPQPSGFPPIDQIDSAGTYHTNGFSVRTREVGGNDEMDLFQGSKLVLDGSRTGQGGPRGTLVVKSMRSAEARVKHLVSNSGIILAGSGSTPQNLRVIDFEQSGTTNFVAANSGRGINLTIDKLSGDGSIIFEEQRVSDKSTRFSLKIADASAYSGKFVFEAGALTMDADLNAPLATFTLKPGSNIDLNGKTIKLRSAALPFTQANTAPPNFRGTRSMRAARAAWLSASKTGYSGSLLDRARPVTVTNQSTPKPNQSD